MPGPREKYNDLTLNTPAGAQLRNAQRRGIEKEGSDFWKCQELLFSLSRVHHTFGTQGFNIQVSRQKPQDCGQQYIGLREVQQEKSRPTALWCFREREVHPGTVKTHGFVEYFGICHPEVLPVQSQL